MKTTGRETEHDRSQGKVVRLPRDWLGPREELVPFGLDEDDQPTSPPPRAADFWGEGSATLQDALEGPAIPVPAEAQDELVEIAEPGVVGDAAEVRPPRDWSVIGRLVPRPGDWRVVGRLAGVGRLRFTRAVPIVIVCAVGMGAAALVISAREPKRAVQHPSSGAAGLRALLATGVGALSRLEAPHKSTLAERRVRRARVVVRHHASAPKPAASPPPTTPAPSNSTGASTPSGSSGDVGASGGSGSGSGSGSGGGSASASGGSNSGGSATHQAGPVGPGAPFGPGHLK